MNSDNVKTTSTYQLSYGDLIRISWKVLGVSTKELIKNACFVLNVVAQNPELEIFTFDLIISKIIREVSKRSDVQSEDLGKLSYYAEAVKSSRPSKTHLLLEI